jgi:hypothetical protein
MRTVQGIRGSRGAWVAAAYVCALLALSTAGAQTTIEEREIRGRGVSEVEAVLNALQEATFQVCGVQIRADLTMDSVLIEDDDVRMIDQINRNIQATSTQRPCEFQGYDVLGVAGGEPDVLVRVLVKYAVYRVPGPAMKRRRLAVLEFPMDEVQLYGSGGGRQLQVDGSAVRSGTEVDFKLVRKLQHGFRAKVEELLTQGRRFGVLDRNRPEVYEAEKQILTSGDVDVGERARLGRVIGADYLVYGTIDRVAIESTSRVIRATGERIARSHGATKVRFTVLAAATRQVKWSSSINLDRRLPVGLVPEAAAEALLEEVAVRMVDELTENIYPPRVTEVLAPGQFVVNRGGNTVEAGSVFEVFTLGDWLLDPDTGERLDRLETSVGIARIVAVKPKYSIAELISEVVHLSRGMVLRRRQTMPEEASRAPTRQRSFADEDGDGIPDYLNRLNQQ